ncbi:hypothetical protein BGZ80_007727 [Entomortierella chlamydospora]|uniref:Nap family protein n=1 Tax=Entomortierella chlamydospora TaxID=101097 RepID=A0A9P6N415_9FUNG|nr:hypothetical protein BGZ79_001646 [Entomortierella chlamydospora]KAG0023853.1 hypothetical protein BGZ80_007727 [Entomortierella chlamydospora]
MAEVDHAALEAVQEEIEALAKLTEDAELEIALKRNELMTPVFEKRREIIAKIPKFWPTVLQLSDAFSTLIEEHDLPVLEHLTDVWVKNDPKDARLFDIVFTFSENPYFTNKEVIKRVLVRKDEDGEDEPYGADFKIDWKEGKDLTNLKRKKDEESSPSSFFEWFNDEDVNLAQFIVQDFFPEALSIYTNGGEDDFGDDQSEDLEDEEDEDEEEEEEEHPKKKSKK